MRAVVPLVIGSEREASVATTSSDNPSGNDSACMPINAAARGKATLWAVSPIRRMPAPIAPDRLSVLASTLATKDRRR
ncbi:MAG: hypothetical protein JSR65_12620 [Proteobacteria bacterium]|nr:hypothetical protein [Pseudomonadota bacterium]